MESKQIQVLQQLLGYKIYEEYEEYVIEGNLTKNKSDLINKSHLITGLCSEVGEVAAHIQKSLRKEGIIKVNQKDIKEELGDCLWYLIALINTFDSSLEEIIEINMKKLNKRYNKNVK